MTQEISLSDAFVFYLIHHFVVPVGKPTPAAKAAGKAFAWTSSYAVNCLASYIALFFARAAVDEMNDTLQTKAFPVICYGEPLAAWLGVPFDKVNDSLRRAKTDEGARAAYH